MGRRSRVLNICAIAVALGVVSVSCSGGDDEEPAAPATSTTTSTTAAPPTTEPPPPLPRWPLTGLEAPYETDMSRPAVVAKIDNDRRARPHAGVNQADIVYELLVEGITRFAVVFHSQGADPIGPVRSARSSDIELLANLHRPLLVWSGANPGVTNEVRRAAEQGLLVDVSHTNGAPHYWRQPGRVGPYNLFTNVSSIRDNHTPSDAIAPRGLFAYRDDAALAGEPTPGVRVEFGQGSVVEFAWSDERGCWLRFQDGPMLDEAGEQICPANVIVQWITYDQSSGSPVARTTGEGDVAVYTAGHRVDGRWSRERQDLITTLTATEGTGIALTPGRTWVALPRAGALGVPIDPERAAALLGEAPSA